MNNYMTGKEDFIAEIEVQEEMGKMIDHNFDTNQFINDFNRELHIKQVIAFYRQCSGEYS